MLNTETASRNMRPGILFTSIISAMPGMALGQPPEFPVEAAAKIDAILAPFDSDDSPGCALAVVKDRDVVYSKVCGMADLERAIRLSSESVFQLASESKQFTAAAVLRATRLGVLSLDDDVRKYVTELPDYGVTITLRHLLNHTSGMRDYGTLWLLAGQDYADHHTADRTLALLAAQRHLNFAPGESFCYSNSGYFLLGLVVSRATGLPLHEFAEEQLFEPLAMKATRFVEKRGQVIANRAVGHRQSIEGGFERYESNCEIVGARGVVSTIADLARWESVYHDQALGEALTSGLLTQGRLASGYTLPYAAGLVIEDFDGLLTVSHGGVGDGSSAFLLRFPELRLSIICLANCSRNDLPGIAWRTAITCMYGPYRDQTIALQTPSPPPQFIELPDERLRAVAGAYRDSQSRAVTRVSVHAGALLVDSGRGRLLLRPLSANHFATAGPGQRTRATFRDRTMRLETDGQPPELLDRCDLSRPDDSVLPDYAGDYYSEELDVTWSLEVRDGALHFAGLGTPIEAFEPTVLDEFALGRELRVSFARDATGRIVAMSAHTDRVWDLRFARR